MPTTWAHLYNTDTYAYKYIDMPIPEHSTAKPAERSACCCPKGCQGAYRPRVGAEQHAQQHARVRRKQRRYLMCAGGPGGRDAEAHRGLGTMVCGCVCLSCAHPGTTHPTVHLRTQTYSPQVGPAAAGGGAHRLQPQQYFMEQACEALCSHTFVLSLPL